MAGAAVEQTGVTGMETDISSPLISSSTRAEAFFFLGSHVSQRDLIPPPPPCFLRKINKSAAGESF